MINKGDIKDILLVLLLAAIAVGISVGAEHLFYEYVSDGDDANTEQIEVAPATMLLARSYYCRRKHIPDTVNTQWVCRRSTPNFIKVQYGAWITRRV